MQRTKNFNVNNSITILKNHKLVSSRREVLIRIALLQRKTLIETKNRTLKCLKWHYSTVRSMKNVVVLTEDGAFALCFRPHPGGFDNSRVPPPGFAIQRKKNANARGSARGKLTDALGNLFKLVRFAITFERAVCLWG